MGQEGYASRAFVISNYKELAEMAKNMEHGSVYELIAAIQVKLGVKHDKAIEYFQGLVSECGLVITNEGETIDLRETMMHLKHLRPANWRLPKSSKKKECEGTFMEYVKENPLKSAISKRMALAQ